jgi:hypothetical protein
VALQVKAAGLSEFCKLRTFAGAWPLADRPDSTIQTSPRSLRSLVRSCSSSHVDTGPLSRIRQCGPGCGA